MLDNPPSIRALLSPLDWGVFCFILLLTVGAVIYGHLLKRRQISEQNGAARFLDYLIMGRRLTLPMFVATLVATWYGGIFGVTSIAYNYGIYNFLTQGVFWYVSYLIFAFFLVKRVRAFEAVTLPELVGKMFGPRSAKLAAVFNFFNVLPVAYAISLGLLAQALFGGSLFLNMSLCLSVVVLYSVFGGFRAVVFSDVVQFFVMCSAVFLVMVFSVAEFGGWGYLRANLPETHFHLFGELGLAEALIWGFIAMATLIDPNFYQRCFAAKSDRTAFWGILGATAIWLVFDLCTTFGAMYARAALPDAEPSFAYLVYAVQVLPDGFRGFLLAGLLATILSTFDSYVFIAGTTVSYDLAPKRFQRKLWWTRLSIIAAALLSLILALIFEGDIKLVWKTLGTYFAACLLFPVLFGYVFPGRVSDRLFVASCLSGVAVVTLWSTSTLSNSLPSMYPGITVTASVLLFGLLRRRIS